MPRPKRRRRVCAMPQSGGFMPMGIPAQSMPVVMTVDEYETIRLIDLEEMTQEQCAVQMAVARTTVTGIYDSARKKLADAVVNGKRLVIQGGNYLLCEENCPKRGCGGRGCPHHRCKNERKETTEQERNEE